jgi:hypothetical protein
MGEVKQDGLKQIRLHAINEEEKRQDAVTELE